MKYTEAAKEVDGNHEQTPIRQAFQKWRDEVSKPCTCWLCGSDRMDDGWEEFLAGSQFRDAALREKP